MSETWLPQLVLMDDFNGDWNKYLEVVYGFFRSDFIESKPTWPGRRLGLKRYPIDQGKEVTFWHFISEGKEEADRIPDIRRCERIRWPRPMIESFFGKRPTAEDKIVWWKNKRGTEDRYLLALPDFSYLVVMADRGDYVLPWTQYPIEPKPAHKREKKRKEYDAYWTSQNC